MIATVMPSQNTEFEKRVFMCIDLGRRDAGANTRNEKWRGKNRQIVASPKVFLYAGRMKTGEGWPSGLRRAPRKRVGANVPQGFKSPDLLHRKISVSVLNAMNGLIIVPILADENC